MVLNADDGLRVVLSPIQLAAILQGASIGEPEGWSRHLWNRVEGGATVLFGGIELVGSAALLLAPEPTMLTKVAGVTLGVHGSDTAGTGLVELWTGQHHVTMTAQAVAAAARSLGYSDSASDRAGLAVDIMVPILLTGVLGAVRATAIRSGRIALAARESEQVATAASRWSPAERARYANLEDEENLGGHTIGKHVAQSEADLRARLAAEPKVPSASSFRSIEDAEKFISRGLIENASKIQAWAARAKPGATERFVYGAGETVGYGVVRSTNMLQDMGRLRIVMRKLASQDQIYFILTCFPEP